MFTAYVWETAIYSIFSKIKSQNLNLHKNVYLLFELVILSGLILEIFGPIKQ